MTTMSATSGLPTATRPVGRSTTTTRDLNSGIDMLIDAPVGSVWNAAVCALASPAIPENPSMATRAVTALAAHPPRLLLILPVLPDCPFASLANLFALFGRFLPKFSATDDRDAWCGRR